jgi:mannose-1-phosphate guanylyltransferase
MKIVIFAGGTGRRLWPISRQSSPKQFEPIIHDKSTLQLSVDRVRDTYGMANIFVSTNERYADLIQSQLLTLPPENLIAEPARRDLAAAVGLAMVHMLARFGPEEEVAIIWGDNYMTDEQAFLGLLRSAGGILQQNEADIVFVGETPRFANDNLGWIKLGRELGVQNRNAYHEFESWHYRPDVEECERMFASGNYVWNTGYFVTTPGFIAKSYELYQPAMWRELMGIGATIGDEAYNTTLHRVYPSLDIISFDDAVVQKMPADSAVVLHGVTGWSDPGTLYALKESVNPDPDTNAILGTVVALNARDCLLYNYEEGKLLAAAGLDGMIVVNTDDAIVVVHKDHIKQVKQLVNGLAGTDMEKYS